MYSTLGRLARDGKVETGEAESGEGPDRKRYFITDSGKRDVTGWLAQPIEPEPHLQTQLFIKIVLTIMLGRSAEQYLAVQREKHLERMRELTAMKQQNNIVDTMLADYGLFHLEADLRWIDNTVARLDSLTKEVTG